MKSSPNYIHFRVQWQVLGPESPGQRFERKEFQRFFEKLNANERFGGYDDFLYRPDKCELVKARGTVPQGGQAFSKVVYGNDALSVVEEFAEYSTQEFAQHLKIVLDAWFGCFPQTVIVLQNSCLRALITPLNHDNSLSFLGDDVLKLRSVFQSKLDQMPQKVGFTFACQRKYGSVPLTLEAKVNSWRDRRSVWIEVNGAAPMAQPLNAANHDQAEALFGKCRQFMEEEVVPLLDDYDKASPEDTAGAAQ